MGTRKDGNADKRFKNHEGTQSRIVEDASEALLGAIRIPFHTSLFIYVYNFTFQEFD